MRNISFKDWMLLQEGKTSGKTVLYPMGYGGIGLYPLQTYLPGSADAILYISIDDRGYSNGDGAPFDISHLPGPKCWKNPNSGTKAPFDIRHIPGPKPYKNHNGAGTKAPFTIKHIKGPEPHKNHNDAKDRSPFSIKHLKK